MRYWGGGRSIEIGIKCCPNWLGMCWLYLFLLLLLSQRLVPEDAYLIHFGVHFLMVQNLVCAQDWLQALVPIYFRKSKDEVEVLEDEFHDLGNMLTSKLFVY